MQLIYLAIVFFAIVLLLMLRRPLYQAISGGLAVTVLLYKIPLSAIPALVLRVFTQPSSLAVLLSLYLVTYLQRMLEGRSLIKQAQADLNNLVHNRRVNVAVAPMFIGLLPSAAAMLLCGDIVKDACDDYLEPGEQSFVASWFRHIPESSLPTYSGVLLMLSISGVSLPKFMLGMTVPVILLIIIGSVPYLLRLPRDPGTARTASRGKAALKLISHLWSLPAILLLILIAGLSVVPAVLLVIVACALVYRFKPKELLNMAVSAFEVKLLLNSFLVLVLKEFIAYSGVLELLPSMLSTLPIPSWLVFALMFFLGGIISGTSGIIALAGPLAFSALPGTVPLAILYMCMCHGASMISPTHVCMVVAAEHFKVSLGELIRRSLVPTLVFCTLSLGYYLLLILI